MTMKNPSKTILFFGTDSFSAISLNELIEKGFTIGAVITKPDMHKGRGQIVIAPEVKIIAQQNDIPVWQPKSVSDITDDVINLTKSTGDKPLGVLVSYGRIIPQKIINLFSPGIINVHPSLLPLYRGPSPIESAILNGETETGVTIMQLSKEMDAGPIYSQAPFKLKDTETTPELEQKLGELGAQELTRVLPAIISGALQPIKQNNQVATYCKLLKKSDGLLDAATLASITAEQAERFVRAYRVFPKTTVKIGDYKIVITRAHVTSKGHTPLDIACSDGRFLAIDELISPSGRTMNAKAFLNGHPNI